VTDRPEAAPSGETESCASASASTSAPQQDDMIDMPADFQRWPFLHRVLGECRDSLVALYSQSDRAALDEQRVHRVWVNRAAWSATAAVCLAILQLAHVKHWTVSVLEAVAVAIALVSFARGERSRERWLTERHKAERCRFLKFAAIIRPDNWMASGLSSGNCAPELGANTEKVSRMCFADVEKWLDDDKLPSPPGRIVNPNLKHLAELRHYYLEKRVNFQVDYFRTQLRRDVTRDEWWRDAPHRLFKASVLIVAVHVAIELAKVFAEWKHLPMPGKEMMDRAEIALDVVIACAAWLPVTGSGIRIWRSANEATRNISRFRAKHLALSNIKDRLEKGKLNDAAEAESVLRDLWCAEQIMESEHREWLRLMMGAEWVG
jgi:hypothetical protein